MSWERDKYFFFTCPLSAAVEMVYFSNKTFIYIVFCMNIYIFSKMASILKDGCH